MPGVDDVLHASLQRANKLLDDGANAKGLLKLLQQADADLKVKLSALAVAGGGPAATFGAAQARAYQAQAEVSIAYVKNRLAGITHDLALQAVKKTVASTAKDLEQLDKAFTGVVIPLRLREAAQFAGVVGKAFAPLAAQHATSADRYGVMMTGEFRQIIRSGLMMGANNGQLVDALVGHGGPKGPKVSIAARVDPATGKVVRLREEDIPEGLFARKRYWAQRIVRTEIAHAQNEARLRTIEEEAKDEPDLGKKILAVLDNRTAPDSIYVHGQVRKKDELFMDGAGRQYLRPPARPNDRETIVPWRLSWAETEFSAPIPPEEVAEAVTAEQGGEARRLMVEQMAEQHQASAAQNAPAAWQAVEALVAKKTASVIAASKVAADSASLVAATQAAWAAAGEAWLGAEAAVAKASTAAEAKAQASVTAAGQAKAAEVAKAKVEAAKQKAEAYKAKVTADKEKKALEAEVAMVASVKEHWKTTYPKTPEGTQALLAMLNNSSPAALGPLYRHLVGGGKLPATFAKYAHQKSWKNDYATAVAKKLGYPVPKKEPKKPVTPPAPPAPKVADLYEIKLVAGKYLDVHDKQSGKKLGFVLQPSEGHYTVTPPGGLPAEFVPKKWTGAKVPDEAVLYALKVSEAIGANKSKIAASASAAVAESQAKIAAAAKASEAARGPVVLSEKYQQWRRPEVKAKPSEEIARRWTDLRHGVGVASDGGAVENHSITVQQETDEKGDVFLVLRFKLTARAGERAVEKMYEGGGATVSDGWRYERTDVGSTMIKKSSAGDQSVRDGVLKVLERDGVRVALGKASGTELGALHNKAEVRVLMAKKGALPGTQEERARLAAKMFGAAAKKAEQVLGVPTLDKLPGKDEQQVARRAALLRRFGSRETIAALQNKTGDELEQEVGRLWAKATPLAKKADKDAYLAEVAPGRVGLFSPALAQVATGNNRFLYHRVRTSAGLGADVEVWEQMFGALGSTNDFSPLLSSVERFNRGIFTEGMSTESDYRTGGADSVFTRTRTGPKLQRDHITIDGSELGRLDIYSFSEDKYGAAVDLDRRAGTAVMDGSSGDGSGNETMLRSGVSMRAVRSVVVPSAVRAKLLERAAREGVTEWNGIPVEELFLSEI